MQFQHKLHVVYLINDILHHCQRKGAQDLRKALEDVVVPVFFCTQLGESTENLQKVTKVLGIWESHNLFEPSLLQVTVVLLAIRVFFTIVKVTMYSLRNLEIIIENEQSITLKKNLI